MRISEDKMRHRYQEDAQVETDKERYEGQSDLDCDNSVQKTCIDIKVKATQARAPTN